MIEEFTDESLMPYGARYKGYMLKNIPASHFVFLYDIFGLGPGPLRDYVEKHIERFREENNRQMKNSSR